MISSPFESPVKKSTIIPDSAHVVVVADMFREEYEGGAELTTDALINSSDFNVFKVRSRDISMETLESGHRKHWVFTNFSQMDSSLIPAITANIEYSIVEYDYKFCRYRSIEKHKTAELKDRFTSGR